MTSNFECLLLNGSFIVARLHSITWIENEGCFYGRDEGGEGWYAWDIQENATTSFRRAPAN